MGVVASAVNLLGLAFSLWLGFYILTRSPSSRVSWLAALTLWSLSSFFLHNALAVNLPDSNLLSWMRYLVVLSLPFWLHLSVELTRDKVQYGTTRILLTRVGVGLCYILATIIVGLAIFQPALFLIPAAIPRLSLSNPTTGPLYAAIVTFVLVGVLSIFLVLALGRRRAATVGLQQQFSIFLLATAIAGGGALYIVIGTSLGADLPIFLGDAVLATGVTMLGYAVAKFNALIEGRLVERDFIYALLAVGSLTAFYVLIAVMFYLGRQMSFLTLVLTIVGSLSFNALYDGIRVALDRLFYRGQFERLRSNLRAFAREAGTGRRLNEHLQEILGSICRALQIRKGFVALKEQGEFVIVASMDANRVGQRFPSASLSASETVGLVRPERKGLEGMELLVPLKGSGAQIGAIVLGGKETNDPYSEQDYDFLDDLVDLTRVIHATQEQEENIKTINAMVEGYRERERALQLQLSQMVAEKIHPTAQDELVEQMEDALRHMHDFSYLSEHPFSQWRVVESERRNLKESAGSIARGKALNQIILRALERIRPSGVEPSTQKIPSREWHPFVILNDSYVKDEPNRNVMSRLYISEGTFNRTRRRALREVTRALQEMERDTQ